MTAGWSREELERIGRAEELEIAAKRADGTLQRWVPIWVVCVGEQVFVRTWYRRDSGWFGHVLDSRRARLRVPGLEADVAVEESNAWNLWMGQPKRLTCQEGSYPSGDLLVLKQDRRANAGRKGTTRAQFSPRAVQCPGPGGRFVADR